MTLELAGSLLVLALIDSTSFGTLLLPIWFLLSPGRAPVGRILVFLGTVAGFYLVVGLGLLFGLEAVLGRMHGWIDDPLVIRAQLVLGAGLVVWSFFLGRKRSDAGGDARPGRLGRWRERALGRQGDGGMGGLIAVALGAALLEVATMLPYLGAIGLLGTSGLAAPARIGTLAVYCVVMVLPALLLLILRLVAQRLVEPLLRRISRWMEKSAGETTAWIVGIVGFLVARDALSRMPDAIGWLDIG